MIILYGFINLIAAVAALNAYSVSKIRGRLIKTSVAPIFLEKAIRAAKKHGITQKSDVLLYMIMSLLGIIMGVAALIAGNFPASVILLLTPMTIVFFILMTRKKKVSSVFQKNAYKLYKYILNQASAGVRPSEAMKKMYDVVEEKKLKRNLMEACAIYSVSLDTDILAKAILENIDTPEARSFAMTIKDKLFESRDSNLMERLEQLMFNRYFAYVQRATDNIKTRCLIVVVLLCSVVVIMVLIPTMLDVQNALNSIFTQ